MNTRNTITPFLFGESTIRSTVLKGVPWFSAKDVCDCLGITNSSMAVNGSPKSGNIGLHESEKITVANHEGNPRAGVPHEMTYVNESGLYALIFKSRKKEAVAFRLWVTSEVLPSIRRTGSFHRGHQAYLFLIEDQIALGVSPDLAARMAGKLTNIPKEELEGYTATPALEQEIDEITRHMVPDASYSTLELAQLLPKDHVLRIGSKASVASSLGKIMTKAALLKRVEKLPGRHVRYRLPVITAFPGTAEV